MRREPEVRAFGVRWAGLPDGESVCFATSAGKAKYAFWLDLADAWPDAKIQELKARRIPDLDEVQPWSGRLGYFQKGRPSAELSQAMIETGLFEVTHPHLWRNA